MKKINKIFKVGKFINFTAKGDITFKKLNLIYAENAMGKSTLTNIFRSLSENDPKYILAKTDDDNYRIEIARTDGTNYIFDKNGWKNIDNIIQNNIEIYDNVFIEKNIHSGFIVNSEHKKHLTKLIIGEEQIKQNKLIEAKKEEIEKSKEKIKNFFETKIKNKNIDCTLKLKDFEEFNKLDISNIINLEYIDNKILEQQKQIEIIKYRDIILNKENVPYLDFVRLKPNDINDFKNILKTTIKNIEKDSENKVKEHLIKFSENKYINRNWLNIGVNAISNKSECPFCGSNIIGNELIKAYQDVFNKEYNDFKTKLLGYKNFAQTIRNTFNKIYQFINEIKNSYDTFWNKYCKLSILGNLTFENYLKEKIKFNFTDINSIDRITNTINELINLKEKSILEEIDGEQIIKFEKLYEEYLASHTTIGGIIKNFFDEVNNFKMSLQKYIGNINDEKNKLISFEQKKYKFCIENNIDYDGIKVIKKDCLNQIINENVEIAKLNNCLPKLRNDMNNNIENVIKNYKNDINSILKKFNTSFEIDLNKLKFNTAEPSSELIVRIGEKCIKQSSKNTDICEIGTIGNALSEGDKTSLAFAFFIAKLKHDNELQNKIIIFDDPMCSLDKSRKTETIKQIIDVLKKAKSVFILSHDSYFLEKILKETNKSYDKQVLHIFMNGNNGSCIEEFDLEKENQSDYFKNFYILKEFYDNKKDLGKNNINIMRTIRQYLEGLLRRIYPDKFNLKDKCLGNFINIIRTDKVFEQNILEELEEINDFTREYHHCDSIGQTNISFTELFGFVDRTLHLFKK